MTLRKIALLSLILFQFEYVLAEQSATRLAQFENSDVEFADTIEMPYVDAFEDVTMYCYAFLDIKGKFQGNECFPADGVGQGYAKAVRAATREAGYSGRMLPALRNGEMQIAAIHYRVHFEKTYGINTVRVFPNWGQDVESYGDQYRAPQRISASRETGWCRSRYSFLARAMVSIDKNGKRTSDVSISSEGGDPPQDCLDYIRRTLESSTYIPGEFAGRRVAATYVEVWPAFRVSPWVGR